MKNSRKYFLFGLLFILIPYVFWFFLGEESYILIHDNLDGELVYIKKIIEQNMTLNLGFQNEIEGIMNGLPRGLLRSGLNITFLIFAILSPVYAYLVNHLLVHVIGYLGMFLLLKRFFIKENNGVVVIISICFGFISYYHIQYGISISGQPLLLFSFLNLLYNRQKWYDWLIIIVFPFYSFIVVTLPFIIPFLILIGGVYYYNNRVFPKTFAVGILFLCLINVFVEIQLIYSTFFRGDIISHRVEWNNFIMSGEPSLKSIYNTILTYLKATHYHSGVLDVRPIIALFFLGLLFFKLKFTREIKIVGASILFIILWVGLNSSLTFMFKEINFLRSFNSERFYFLLPFLWLLFLALVIDNLRSRFHIHKIVSVVTVLFCLFSIFEKNKEYINNTKILLKTPIEEPNFREFFAEDLFGDIKTYLGENEIENHNFLSLGIFPNVAQYHGFNTLDSYQNNYLLSYKHQFRKIIQEELEKNKGNQKYFDFWGSRCYLFSSEIGRRYIINKEAGYTIKNLSLNSEQFKVMNGKYLISSVPIMNHDDIDFKFLKSFSNSKSFWKLYLYVLDEKHQKTQEKT
ncbi:DUF6044 family protein [Aquimarina sediminis]|uniref:DUF6044 family protein n=1 Tax=Aquimarina sediminis TaxID=2070536 RepID=UPI000CA05725|nr:DUF6044 family protein [Aquimarina sediminis]